MGRGQHECNPLCASSSGEHETVAKLFFYKHWGGSCLSHELVNEPLPVALKDTLTTNTEGITDSIQAGFGGLRLKPTVEKCHGSVIDGGNVVAVQKHFSAIFFVDHFGVVTLPVAGVTNGGDHLLFDLTHWGWLR
jgi:hypothetical protein